MFLGFTFGANSISKEVVGFSLLWFPRVSCLLCLLLCMLNKEAQSLFILFHSLETHSNMLASLNNYLLEPTSLGVSNNPSAPQLVGTLPPLTNKEVYPEHNGGDYCPNLQ